MIKGCQKRMIFIKDTGCDLFEEAYFILKSDIPLSDCIEDDIVRVATEIINQNKFAKKQKKNRKSFKGLFSFLGGAILGVIGAIIFSFIF